VFLYDDFTKTNYLFDWMYWETDVKNGNCLRDMEMLHFSLQYEDLKHMVSDLCTYNQLESARSLAVKNDNSAVSSPWNQPNACGEAAFGRQGRW
jgi:hypothetical protein